jgi:predicted amidohydrolase YtcJ
MLAGTAAEPMPLDKAARLSPIPNQVRATGVKLFQDGSLQGFTGFLTAPYQTQPAGKSDYVGYPARPRERLVESVRKYHRAGYQIAIHGNGDAAIDDILYAFRVVQQEMPRSDARHRIEHCQTPREDQLAAMKELGITPSFFVGHVYYWGDRHRDIFLGAERAAQISPLASALRHGLRFTVHNDTPVTPVNPLLLVWCSVNRLTKDGQVLGPEQRIGVFEALRAVTGDAAWQNFEEKTKGTIEPGKLADFVVLAENPLTVQSERLKDLEILQTIVGGQTVYDR